MAKATKKNFTEGPLFWRLTLFAIPIMLTGFFEICQRFSIIAALTQLLRLLESHVA